MTTGTVQTRGKTIRLVARVIGPLATVNFLFWYLYFSFDPIMPGQIILAIVFGIVVLSGCIVSWWHELLGGILFILGAVGIFVVPAFFNIVAEPVWNESFLLFVTSWAYPGIPLLIAGALFLITSLVTKGGNAMSNGFFGRLTRKWWLMLVIGIIIGLAVGLPAGGKTMPGSLPGTTILTPGQPPLNPGQNYHEEYPQEEEPQ